jgi:hypothetical protein
MTTNNKRLLSLNDLDDDTGQQIADLIDTVAESTHDLISELEVALHNAGFTEKFSELRAKREVANAVKAYVGGA